MDKYKYPGYLCINIPARGAVAALPSAPHLSFATGRAEVLRCKTALERWECLSCVPYSARLPAVGGWTTEDGIVVYIYICMYIAYIYIYIYIYSTGI